MSLSFADAAFWLAVVLCAVAQVAILRSALVVRAAPLDRGVPSARRPLEVLWALVPALVLALVLVLTWRAMRAPAPGHDAPGARTPGSPAPAPEPAPAMSFAPTSARR